VKENHTYSSDAPAEHMYNGLGIWRPFTILNFRNLTVMSHGLYGGHAILLPCANFTDVG